MNKKNLFVFLVSFVLVAQGSVIRELCGDCTDEPKIVDTVN